MESNDIRELIHGICKCRLCGELFEPITTAYDGGAYDEHNS